MNGLIPKTVAVSLTCWAGAAAWAGGPSYYDLVDPCYPARYNHMARNEVKAAFCSQVHNGHALDQTVWNYHFEPGSAVLTPGGMEHLAYLARKRPCPDPAVFLQVAYDVPYNPTRPNDFVVARVELDSKRIQAVTDFLTAQTAGREISFCVTRHDPGEVGMSAVPMGASIRGIQTTSLGSRGGAAGTATGGR